MEKSDVIQHHEKDASAPSVYFNQPAIYQQGFIHPDEPPVYQDIHIQPGFLPNTQQPIITFPTSVRPIQIPKETYFKRLHTNRRQFSSVTGGLFLILVSGLHIGWGIWRTIFVGLWQYEITQGLFIFTIMIWPLGALVGGFIGSALTLILRKIIIYYITALIMIAGNLLFIIWHEHHASIIVGRMLTSLAHGIVFVTIVRHASENVAKNMRGTILSTINCTLYVSIFISVSIIGALPLGTNFSIERMIGIMGLIFAVSSIICARILTVETIPHLLAAKRPNDAMVNLKYLRDSINETSQIANEMEEFKMMTVQEQQYERNIFKNGNGKALGLMIMARLMVALTNNFLLNDVLINFSALAFKTWEMRLTPMAVVAPRLLAAVGQIFYADYFRRQTQIIVSSISAGVTVILLGIALNAFNFRYYIYISIIFSVIFQFFCGVGLDQMPDVYLSEAFPMAKKSWSISFVTAIEHIFHTFMIGMVFLVDGSLGGSSALLFTVGALIIVFGLISFGLLPDTNGKTLKQAQDLFQLFRYSKLFERCKPSTHA